MSNSAAMQFYQQAESLKAQGRLAEAAAGYRAALEHDPHALPLWWALGDLYAQMEDFTGVENCCKEILARNPDIAEVRLYLGMALQRQNRLAEAEAALLESLRLNPELAEGRHQLAVVQQSLGNTRAAMENYRRALTALQDPAPALYNLGMLCLEEGRIDEAYDHVAAAVRAAPASLKYRQQFVRLLNEICPDEITPEIRSEILRCFDTPGLDTGPLMKPGMHLLAAEPVVLQAVQLARQPSADQFRSLAAQGGLNSLFGDRLFQQLLVHTKIASPEVETLLCALRRLALDDVMRVPGMDTRFMEALACQFFNTEYAAFVAPEEAGALDATAAVLNSALAQGAPANTTVIRKLLTFCMYRPLSSLESVGPVLGRAGNPLTAALPEIVRRQWTERRTELALKERIETLTPVDTGVSASVREQYEESPYPRWFSVDLCEPVDYRESLRMQLPGFDPPDFGQSPIDILVAGCGTGRHAIMLATHFADSRLLAVDLSKTSLAYAMRKSGELGLGNIRFAQADILGLGSLGRRFHIIESVGVLHHMREPLAGLKVLADVLVKGGLMRLGLYSAHARRAVTAAREYIEERGFPATPDSIRAARQALLALAPDHPAHGATGSRDFYTLSECRDLLFHVQEHCLRIPELEGLLEACGLKFIGFSFSDRRVENLYRERYPDDPAMTDLANWDAFEQAYPDTFAEMYQFWCQKA